MSEAADEVPMDRLAKVYLKIRTKIQELERAHEAQLEELKQQRDVIALQIKDMMLALGSKSVKTDAGTVILSHKTRYYASDWDEMKKFILENEAIDLLERRVAQTNMATFLEQNPGKVPPGLNSTSEYEVSVRKPTK